MRCRLAVLVLLLAAPALAFAAIYKWVDENGTTVYSNVPPDDRALAKQAKVVVRDDTAAPAAPRDENARREREFREVLARIDRIEQELAAQRSAPPVQYVAPQMQPVPQAADWTSSPAFFPGVVPAVVFPSVVIVRPKPRFFFPRSVQVRQGFRSSQSFRSFHPMRR
jgi:hypothetical protein